MRLDNLFQFIVPLTFLAIWALTALFNREAQPLPPRAGRPQPPGGPGKGGPSTSFRSESLNRDPSQRWSTPPARRPVRPDDSILIIEETQRPPASTSASTRSSAGAAPRRGNRARQAPAGSPKRPEATSSRPLSGALGAQLPISEQMSRPLTVDPLSISHSPLLTGGPRNLSQTVSEATRMPDRPVPVTDDFRLLLNNPAKLREAVIVNEILQPPLSLRRRQG